jgi:hypothetical protein
MTIIFRFVFFLIVLFGSSAIQGFAPDPYPIEDWGKRADMSNVSLSPDGNKLALLKIPTRDGNPILEIYDANDLGARPFQMDADPMEMTRFYWATDDKIIFSARQKVRDKIDGFNEGVYKSTRGVLTLDKDPKKSEWTKLSELNGSGGGLLGPVRTKPNKFITYSYAKGSRYPSYYEYDVKTGRRKLITKESPKVSGIQFDGHGNPQFGSGYDGGSNEFLTFYRKKGVKIGK